MFGFGPKIDVDKINTELSNGEAVLVDVRRDDEWDYGHAAGAMHLAVDNIMRGEVPVKNTQVKVYLYCASGARASAAQRILQQQGYTVENLGGLSSWIHAGGATE